MKSKAFFVAGTLACCIPLTAQAETLSPMVITAERVAKDPARVSSNTTVIDEAAIRRAQVRHVADLLRRQASLQIASSGGPGKATSLFMRGGNSGHVLVLVDGVRVGSATTGSFDWALMSPEDIERIEIVRGPQSSLYGADAMSGVVQIITRQGQQGTNFHMTGEAGGLGSASGSMQIGGMLAEHVSYAMSAGSRYTRGVSAAANGSEPDAFRQANYSGKLNFDVGRGQAELVMRRTMGHSGLDGGFPFGDVLTFKSSSSQSVFSGKIDYPLSGFLDTSLQLSQSRDDANTVDTVTATNNSDLHTRMTQFSWQNRLESETVSVLAGLDHHEDAVLNRLAPIDRVIRQTGAYLSSAWMMDRIDVNAALRYDRNSASNNKATYKTGLVVRPLPNLKLTANYGTAFKAPSVNDLYWPASGNANLKPESSKAADVGASYAWKAAGLSGDIGINWFHQSFQDLIAWAPITPGSFTWIPKNISQATSKGYEFSVSLRGEMYYVQAAWNWLSAMDLSTGKQLPRRARESGNILLGLHAGQLHIEGNISVVGPRFSNTTNTQSLGGYHKTDISLRYALNKHWTLTGRVDNLENKHYTEITNYGVPGRVWFAGSEVNY